MKENQRNFGNVILNKIAKAETKLFTDPKTQAIVVPTVYAIAEGTLLLEKDWKNAIALGLMSPAVALLTLNAILRLRQQRISSSQEDNKKP
jgi:hypothetical protein